MKKILLSLISFTALSAVAESQSPMQHFVNQFADKMTCDGVRQNGRINKQESVSVEITVSDKNSNQPIFEVKTSANDHFKIGAGYAASLDKVRSPHAYHYDMANKVLYYVPYMFDASEVDEAMLMRIRDAGGLMYVSSDAIAFRGYQQLLLSSCQAAK